MKKKKYIKPDITIIPMDNEIVKLDHISGTSVTYGADDTGMKGLIESPQAGGTLGHDAPDESKKNQMWDLWEY